MLTFLRAKKTLEKGEDLQGIMPHVVREAPLREEKREVNNSPAAMKAF